MISIFGERLAERETVAAQLPLAMQLGGTAVVLAGRAVPLSYASEGRVNGIVPYDVEVNTQHYLVLQSGSNLSAQQPVLMAEAQPAVFTRDQSGIGQGFITDKDGRYYDTDNPAGPGDTIVISCAGLGKVDPVVVAEAPAPADPLSLVINPVSVTIGGQAANVLSAGLKPGETGIYQVVVEVPEGIAAGDRVPVVITVAAQASQPVTIAVR